VRLSYLPSGPLRLFDEKLTAGVGSSADHGVTDAKYALPTAAISATHSLDLQAFTADHSDRRQLPAHVGAPNVTIALKLVQSDTATAKGFHVDGVDGERDAGRADDPFGEIFVRGNSIAGATSAEQWCATGDLGTVRSNGTLVVVQDHQKSVEVDVPTLSSEYPSARRASRIGAGGAPTRIVSLIMLLACTLASLCVMPVDASASLHRRAEGSINSTFVQTSVMAFMSAQRASWEQGVAQSALLEYNAGSWSVFSGKSAPPYVSSERAALPSDLLNMAFAAVKSQNSAGQLCSRVTGDESLTEGSALDPASCGELVLLAAYAQGQVSNNQVSTSGSFGTAAQRQLNYLLNTAPRNPSGAISMRSSAEAYWSDGVYMAPPFIALYGLMTENQTLLQTAYDQVRLYRDALRIPSGTAQGLFYHIVNASAVGGAGQDLGAWLTGNAWSAAGMCRVLAAISQSRFASSMSSQINDLVSWTNEIVSNALDQGTPLMHNYVNETDTFLDAGGSAMIAYSTYRLAAMSPTSDLGRQLAQANAVYDAVQDKLGQDGQLISGTQVVDPLGFVNPSQGSPEGMSFMVLLSAARRDRAEGNVTGLMGPGTGSNDASTLKPSWVTLPVLSAVGVCSLLSAALL
jgi:rhamnogalacturonyl hydrolase YesR